MRELNYENVILKIREWLSNYAKNYNIPGYVLGLSGGIDSAVTASLCVEAMGKENVVGLSLPCESLEEDLEDAKLLVKKLGLKFHVIDLSATYHELLKTLPIEIGTNEMAKANIKPRLRMTTIYYIGQSLGYLVAGTGNRSEIAIGYFTKYGDGGVDLEPLGDLYKCEIKTIARILGVPEKIILKPPSAGLWKGQTDEDEIGLTYDILDEILYRIDNDLDMNGCSQQDIEKVKNLMTKAEHKNRMPPVCKID